MFKKSAKVKQKICIKITLTISAMNFVQEQLNNRLIAGELLTNDLRGVGFVSSQLGLRDANIRRGC